MSLGERHRPAASAGTSRQWSTAVIQSPCHDEYVASAASLQSKPASSPATRWRSRLEGVHGPTVSRPSSWRGSPMAHRTWFRWPTGGTGPSSCKLHRHGDICAQTWLVSPGVEPARGRSPRPRHRWCGVVSVMDRSSPSGFDDDPERSGDPRSEGSPFGAGYRECRRSSSATQRQAAMRGIGG